VSVRFPVSNARRIDHQDTGHVPQVERARDLNADRARTPAGEALVGE
jgi:hypothetical protein